MSSKAYDVVLGSLREHGQLGWLSATFTPKGFSHWTYDLFGKPSPGVVTFRAESSANPFLPPGFVDRLRQRYGDTAYARQEVGGEFVDAEGAEWPAHYFGDDLWVTKWPPDAELTLKVMALDPSKGGTDKPGDYSAYALLGRGRDGCLYVECDLDNRRDVSRIVQDGMVLARRFKPQGFGVESNAFQFMLADELVRQSKAAGIALPIYQVTNTVNKRVRIRTLTPYLVRREFRFVDTPGTRKLVAQMRDFPVGEHDDGPDAVEGAVRLAVELWNGGVRKP